jgi:ribonuclease D
MADSPRVEPAPPRLAPRVVADGAAMSSLLEVLEGESAIALDTESNSFHVYRERVCLIQLSTPSGDWVVDPLVADPRPLGRVLASAPVVVLHGADYDVRCLKREYGFTLPGLFDTMAAARRLGIRELGLSALVERHFGVRLSKAFQRSDWGRRPLSADQVSYAALDTHYLLGLHSALGRQLHERNLHGPAAEEFARIAAVEPKPKMFDAEGWRRLRGARELPAAGQAVLRSLWVAREERASALDRPPFKVMPEDAMLAVARQRPATEQELSRIPGVTPVVLRRMRDAILAALREAEPRDRAERGGG